MLIFQINSRTFIVFKFYTISMPKVISKNALEVMKGGSVDITFFLTFVIWF